MCTFSCWSTRVWSTRSRQDKDNLCTICICTILCCNRRVWIVDRVGWPWQHRRAHKWERRETSRQRRQSVWSPGLNIDICWRKRKVKETGLPGSLQHWYCPSGIHSCKKIDCLNKFVDQDENIKTWNDGFGSGCFFDTIKISQGGRKIIEFVQRSSIPVQCWRNGVIPTDPET